MESIYMATITGRAAILDSMVRVRPLSPRPVVFRQILKNATLVAVLVAGALALGQPAITISTISRGSTRRWMRR